RRRERGSNFDVRPAGLDDATAQQLVAQAFAQQTAPSTAGGMPAAPGYAPPQPLLQVSSVGLTMQQTRHARRLYVGSVPRVTDAELRDFFNNVIDRALGEAVEGGAVVNVYLNQERAFAFVEIKTVELTTACLQLDGLVFQDQQLKIRRPSDYNPALMPTKLEPTPRMDLSVLGIVSTTVPDGPNKVFVGGLPYHLTDDQVGSTGF
ncbi:unnamed protein product, partial [Phaeothamnion confervicola]